MWTIWIVYNVRALLTPIQSGRKVDENEAKHNIQCTLELGTSGSVAYLSLEGVHGLEWHLGNEVQHVHSFITFIQKPCSCLDCRSQLFLKLNHTLQNTSQQKPHLSMKQTHCVLSHDALGCRTELCLNIYYMPANIVALEQIRELCHIPMQVENNMEIVFITRWDWHICKVRSVIMKLKTYTNHSPVHSKFDHIPTEDPALQWIHERRPIMRHCYYKLCWLTSVKSMILGFTVLDLLFWDSTHSLRIFRYTRMWLNYSVLMSWHRNWYLTSYF